MNNIFVYIEIEDGAIADVSLELLTKGRELASKLGVKLEAVVLGHNVSCVEAELSANGAETIWVADDEVFALYRTLPFASVLSGLIKAEQPQIVLFGATSLGRDLAPRVSSTLKTGLTADCTQLEIGSYVDENTGREYDNLLYQIGPAFGGNVIATIICPDNRPQMATVREGVMCKRPTEEKVETEVKPIAWRDYISPDDLAVVILDRKLEERKINLKGANVVVAGGYGMGSKEGFKLCYDLAEVLGAEVGASRAATDAGYCEHERMIGQTGITVRPKLYIACGISGQVQHTVGMDSSSIIVSINSDADAPINKIADYAFVGKVEEVIPKMIKYYKQNSK